SAACAAPNLRAGMTVAAALPGAVVNGVKVARRSVGGIESAAVLCSEAELGLGEDAAGLLELGDGAAPGVPLAELVDAADRIYDLGVTPNRGDWLSVLGVARELAAKTGLRLLPPKPKRPAPVRGVARQAVKIAAAARAACPKFACLPLEGVDAARPTPAFIRTRLQRCGLRPVSAVVDITNYVMLEYGQPLHAFDRARLAGGIVVRFARPAEPLELLDGTKAKLNKRMLVVADSKEAKAVAGVMGGAGSGVTEATTEVLLEAAHFAPAVVRGRSQELKVSSDAAYRFERGVDPALPELALARAASLIIEHCGGRPGPLTVAGKTPAAAKPVAFEPAAVARITGVSVTAALARKRLGALGFKVAARGRKLAAAAPSWRFDVERWQDLAEEIIRLGGYDAVPVTLPRMEGGLTPQAEPLLDEGRARDVLTAAGYSEAITFAFVNPQWEEACYGNTKPLRLANPLGPEHSVMRSGLFGGLLDRANHNFHHRQDSLRLFEAGRCFPAGGGQPVYLAGLCWGAAPSWRGEARPPDYYDARAAVEALLPGLELAFVPGGPLPAALHPGCSARVLLAGRCVGCVGMLHPGLLRKGLCELAGAPALFELDLDQLRAQPRRRRARPFSKLPLVRRDLALLAAADVQAAELVKSIAGLGLPELISVEVFDSFAGGSLPAGQRSIGLRLTLQGTAANLVEARINEIVAAAAAELERAHGAKLRG
ncbi:MAG: phenylalanine--tRNA ligase subunit beta, partial [Betaproteobacteria bacterium AqS2]|nr:phenylalanine--tRNA ligase subunit beta [Betaproteobacteria bacterium AqS2]